MQFIKIVIAAAALACSGFSSAQSYPTRPVTLVVPAAPGGERTFWAGCLPNSSRSG